MLIEGEIKFMSRKTKIKIVKIAMFIIAIALIIGIIIYLAPLMKDLTTTEGQVRFKEQIDALGVKGVFVLIGLQLVQIFLVILPGEPLELLAGMCYGPVWGTIFICATVFVTTTIIFFLVRKYGQKFIYEFFKKEKIDKIENSKAFKNSEAVEFIMIVLFLIPGTPKDLLVYIGGLLPIKPLRFILISTFMRLPSVISSTIAGSNLASGNVHFTIITYVVTFVISIIIMIIANKVDKNSLTKSALKTIK